MAVVGLLTVSDGRRSVHEEIVGFARQIEDRIAAVLEGDGHVVHRAQEPLWTNDLAVSEARRIADTRPDLTIVSVLVWAFPHFTMLAAFRDSRPAPALFDDWIPSSQGWSDCSLLAERSIRSAASTGECAAMSRIRRSGRVSPRTSTQAQP
jgi:L-fucose/D-arabinose isomerase